MSPTPPDPARKGALPRVVGLLGYPATYSVSPAMHNAAFRACGLEWVYTLFPVPPPELADALRGLRALRLAGANVTIPHKEAAATLVDRRSAEAARCGAVNTLVVEQGRLVGHNTDVGGFVRALQEAGIGLAGGTVAILGSGGAARAVVLGVAAQGAERIWVAGRQPQRARELAEQLQPHVGGARLGWAPLGPEPVRALLAQADLVVNATPLGTQGEGADELLRLADPTWLRPQASVVDLVYRPVETRWVQAARSRGLRAIAGGLMLLHQGAVAFELWTGRQAPLAVMRQALEAALGGPLGSADTTPGPAS